MEQLFPDEQGRMHMGVFRWLCLLSFHLAYMEWNLCSPEDENKDSYGTYLELDQGRRSC